MNKMLLGLALMAAITVGQSSNVLADSRTFTVSATIPLATTVSFTPSSVNAATGAFTAVSGTALTFDPLSFNAANGIWLPNHYFALDVASTGGAGGTDVTVQYTEGANPNSPGHGLGWKSTATFVKVAGSVETGLTTHGPKKMLKDLTGEHILPSELTGGFLRMYLGIVTKDPTAVFPDPSASEPFTNGDKAGRYDGSLLVTATIV